MAKDKCRQNYVLKFTLQTDEPMLKQRKNTKWVH